MGMNEFNQKLAARITGAVGTMWCAYIFAAIALISLPAALSTGDPIIIVAWVAQTFLQLVLLSIIMVGQDVQTKGVQKKIDETHEASLAEFELAKEARTSHTQEIAAIKALLLDLTELARDIDTISADVQDIGDDVDNIAEDTSEARAKKRSATKSAVAVTKPAVK
jgi:outer membrane murein-binding lipoprotein Lpp